MNEIMDVDGTPVTVRPIEITDVEDLARMFRRLSRQSMYFRFFAPLPQVPHAWLLRIADVDHFHRDALVARHGAAIIAIASYDELPQRVPREVEFAVAVGDAWQRRGIGLRLARGLGALACERGYGTLIATTLPENRAALGLVRKLAPDANVKLAGGHYEARLALPTSLTRDDPMTNCSDARTPRAS